MNADIALAADNLFFKSLLASDCDVLEKSLTGDFIIIDVMGGSVIDKASFLGVIRAGQLKFEGIEPAEIRARIYQSTAIVIGRTRMSGRFGGAPFTAASRYTHVYVEQDGQCLLASAQGTPIQPA